MEYAIDKNFGFMEVSAKMGQGAKEAINRLVTEIYNVQNDVVEEESESSKTANPYL